MESQAAVQAHAGADEAGLADPGDIQLLGRFVQFSCNLRGDRRQKRSSIANRRSENGLQAGTAPTIFDRADFRRRV